MKTFFNYLLITVLLCLPVISCKQKSVVDKSNPFFTAYNTPFDVPPFEKIMAKHYMPAFEKGMADGRMDIEKIVNQ